jgi:hypothetical protein
MFNVKINICSWEDYTTEIFGSDLESYGTIIPGRLTAEILFWWFKFEVGREMFNVDVFFRFEKTIQQSNKNSNIQFFIVEFTALASFQLIQSTDSEIACFSLSMIFYFVQFQKLSISWTNLTLEVKYFFS